MAANNDNATTPLRVEDFLPVRSRVCWGAIFAGAVVALATYLVLTLLGGAIGLSVSGSVRGTTLGTGAAVWAVITTGAALFLGGWVTSQTTVGENKMEAVVHGIIMWGAVLAMVLWMAAVGVRSGFNALMSVAYAGAAGAEDLTSQDWEAAARRAGVSQETITDWKQKAKDAPANARAAVEDPTNRQAASEYATAATWWTLLGTVLSMLAAVVGALVGAGPSFRLMAVPMSGPGSGYRSREYANT